MRKVTLILFVLFILYILMQGWNATMYRQFPGLIINNYWMFVCFAFLAWFAFRGLRIIR